jgi:hypothetical protein
MIEALMFAVSSIVLRRKHEGVLCILIVRFSMWSGGDKICQQEQEKVS